MTDQSTKTDRSAEIDRLRRSFIYTPADDRKMMEKTAALDVDGIIFDLEDAIPDDVVPEARERIRKVSETVDFAGKEVCARINGPQTESWFDDLAAVSDAVDTISLPMVESATDLETVVRVARRTAGTTSEVIPTIETPRGVFALRDIAEASRTLPEVTGLSFGFGDYTLAIGATGRPASVREYLAHEVVNAAALGGLDPLFTVYQDFSDPNGLREVAEAAQELGYVGQKAIHPAQVEVLNEVYTPSDEEVRQAEQFVNAFQDAERDSLTVDGVFLDTAIVNQYKTVLRRHERQNEKPQKRKS
jgi:citrate lyase subunit beta/citryl-CoA lyase